MFLLNSSIFKVPETNMHIFKFCIPDKVSKEVGYLESAVDRMKKSFRPKHFGMEYIYNNLGAAYMEVECPQTSTQMFA